MRVGIFAMRKIKKGTELTFDYQFERMGQKKQKCHCGEENCRGFLGDKKKKIPLSSSSSSDLSSLSLLSSYESKPKAKPPPPPIFSLVLLFFLYFYYSILNFLFYL